MQTHILDQIAFVAARESLLSRLHIPEHGALANEFSVFFEAAHQVARPKAAYALAGIDDKGEAHVVIEGERFDSRVLAVNVAGCQRVFLCLATCGQELDVWYKTGGERDMLKDYWLDAIKEAALRDALRALRDDLAERYRPGRIASMAPGSLANWPITQQRPLFRLMAEPAARIGQQLTPSCLMEPNKSVSSIRFASEDSFESCMLCPRPGCPNRRTPYDPAQYEERYGMEQ